MTDQNNLHVLNGNVHVANGVAAVSIHQRGAMHVVGLMQLDDSGARLKATQTEAVLGMDQLVELHEQIGQYITEHGATTTVAEQIAASVIRGRAERRARRLGMTGTEGGAQ